MNDLSTNAVTAFHSTVNDSLEETAKLKLPQAEISIGAIGGMILSGITDLFVGAVVMVPGYTLFMSGVRDIQDV